MKDKLEKSPLDGSEIIKIPNSDKLVFGMSDYAMDSLLCAMKESGKIVLPHWYLFDDLKLGDMTEKQFFLAMSDEAMQDSIEQIVLKNTKEIEELLMDYHHD